MYPITCNNITNKFPIKCNNNVMHPCDIRQYLITLNPGIPLIRGSLWKLENDFPKNIKLPLENVENHTNIKTYCGNWFSVLGDRAVSYIREGNKSIFPNKNIRVDTINIEPHIAYYEINKNIQNMINLCKISNNELNISEIITWSYKNKYLTIKNECKNQYNMLLEKYKYHQEDDWYLAAALCHCFENINGWIYYEDSNQIFILNPEKYLKLIDYYKADSNSTNTLKQYNENIFECELNFESDTSHVSRLTSQRDAGTFGSNNILFYLKMFQLFDNNILSYANCKIDLHNVFPNEFLFHKCIYNCIKNNNYTFPKKYILDIENILNKLQSGNNKFPGTNYINSILKYKNKNIYHTLELDIDSLKSWKRRTFLYHYINNYKNAENDEILKNILNNANNTEKIIIRYLLTLYLIEKINNKYSGENKNENIWYNFNVEGPSYINKIISAK